MSLVAIGLVGLGAGVIGSWAGYQYGKSTAASELMELKKEMRRMARLMKAQQVRLAELEVELDRIKASFNILQKLIWIVFKKNPEVAKAFAAIQECQESMQELSDYCEEQVNQFVDKHPEKKIDAMFLPIPKFTNLKTET